MVNGCECGVSSIGGGKHRDYCPLSAPPAGAAAAAAPGTGPSTEMQRFAAKNGFSVWHFCIKCLTTYEYGKKHECDMKQERPAATVSVGINWTDEERDYVAEYAKIEEGYYAKGDKMAGAVARALRAALALGPPQGAARGLSEEERQQISTLREWYRRRSTHTIRLFIQGSPFGEVSCDLLLRALDALEGQAQHAAGAGEAGREGGA